MYILYLTFERSYQFCRIQSKLYPGPGLDVLECHEVKKYVCTVKVYLINRESQKYKKSGFLGRGMHTAVFVSK